MRKLHIPQEGADPRVLGLLQALGAECIIEPLNHILVGSAANRGNDALILSEEQLIHTASLAGPRGESLQRLLAMFDRVFIWPFSASVTGCSAFAQLTGVALRPTTTASSAQYCVSTNRTVCRTFAGLSFGMVSSADRPVGTTVAAPVEWLVTVGDGGVVGRIASGKSEVFLHSSTAVFDVTENHVKNLDASRCFSGLVPLLWFILHVGIPVPRVPSAWANWIIDDPNLSRRYGFVRLADLANAVVRARAALTIAFIPWNYRRTHCGAVNLVRAHKPQLSICVHGCNHTRREFATETLNEAYQLGALALARMRDLQAARSLGFERVMVFPQGKFSHNAMRALRRLDFVGVVNTEVIDSHSQTGVTGRDLLPPAVATYGGLPLFLRRPANDPLANFALDILLGKPCLIVTHHDFFHAGTEPMQTRIEALNRLEPAMQWTSLEDGISSTTTLRSNGNGTVDVRLFSPQAHVTLDRLGKTVFFIKHEDAGEGTVRVRIGGQPVSIERQASIVRFSSPCCENRLARIRIDVSSEVDARVPRISLHKRAAVAARRYLCDFRDNYVDCSPRLTAGIAAVRTFARRVPSKARA